MSESILKTTREFQWRQTNCACAFYCVKGQYIVFQPTTTAICRTCTVVIKKYGLPLVAFTNTKSWHDPPLEILPVAPGHQQPPNIGLLSRDCWWTVATLEAPGILNNYFSTNQMSSTYSPQWRVYSTISNKDIQLVLKEINRLWVIQLKISKLLYQQIQVSKIYRPINLHLHLAF